MAVLKSATLRRTDAGVKLLRKCRPFKCARYASGSTAAPAQMFKLWKNPALEPLKLVDATLYKAGLPNALDIPLRGRY